MHPVVDGETMCGRQHVPYPLSGSRVALTPHTLTPDTKLMEAPGGPGTLARQALLVNIYSQFES